MTRPGSRSSVEAVLYELRALSSDMDGLDQMAAKRFGLNRTDLRGLDVLGRDGAASPTVLARALGLTTGGVTTVIDRLERCGYVRRRPDPSDRRRLIVETTQRADDIGREIFGPLIRRTAKHANTYTDMELAVIRDFLKRHRETITTHVRATAWDVTGDDKAEPVCSSARATERRP